MHPKEHQANLKESIIEIERIIVEGLEKHQRSLGFHTSAAAVDMLEIIFHENNLIDPGMVIKHEWFNSSRKIKEKIAFDFPEKKEMLKLTANIENVRNKLCYGKRQPASILEQLVLDFQKLKTLFNEVTDHEL
ncbi:hypothetical protein J4437_03705 [Candidatus Woesearchaeota archaeon]|nr:hypothetical protein [Candidatus Woesearchaeota archaeon]